MGRLILKLLMQWFEMQEKSNTTQLLQLRRLRDIAAIKRKSTMKQTKIEFFIIGIILELLFLNNFSIFEEKKVGIND